MMESDDKQAMMLDLSESGEFSEDSWDDSSSCLEEDPLVISEVLASGKKQPPETNDKEPQQQQRQTTQPKRKASWGLAGLAAVALVLVTLCAWYGQQRQEHTLQKEQQALVEQRQLLETARLLQQQLDATAQELDTAHTELDRAKTKATNAWNKVSLVEAELERAENQMQQDQALLHKTLAMEEFGPGPHYAEFQIQFNAPSTATTTFVIEFAPLYEMPSTVYLLLRQIRHGLWDGASFFANSPQVMVAQPISVLGDTTALDTMERSGLARLPFAEMEPGFSHEPFTLGLAGNVLPGPNFFINKRDNSKPFDKVKAPCFAKVVQGQDTIVALGQAMENDLQENTGMNGEQEASAGIPKAVEIVSVRLLSLPKAA